eukprot:Lithocolla_globosa_v1_NODE_2950_length_1814_cov_32.370097.p1 type:complete len:256 gc:universal NODE_2950_length_1814_cov_32.370097:1472-705(-)
MFQAGRGAEIVNYDSKLTRKQVIHRNEWMPKNPGIFNCVMVGSSGSGKTNTLLNMLYNFLSYQRIYIYAQNSEQGVYNELQERLEAVAEENEIEEELFHFGSSLENVIRVNDIPNDGKVSVVVFDDFVLSKNQSVIEDFFVRGRHKRCITIYLSQTYSMVPITIRRNARIFLLWGATRGRDVSMFGADAAPDLKAREFLSIFSAATADPYNFLYIDKLQSDNRRFRKNFDGPLSATQDNTKKQIEDLLKRLKVGE